MRIHDVIRRPLITEKTTLQRETHNVYAFEVALGANKIEIARAVEAQFGVKVAQVRLCRMHGKLRRQGRYFGRRSDWKKAYVRLKEGEKTIEFFEGA
jgi:large subunit ribosomal protein L23